MDCFETRSVIDKDTLAELKWWHRRKPREIKFIILYSLLCFVFLIIGIVAQSTFALFVGIFGIILVLAILIRDKLAESRMWERIKENSKSGAHEVNVTFHEDRIKVHDLQSNGTSCTNYDLISRFMETKSMYVLFTKANVMIIANKVSLTQEQKNEDFVRFIREKCKNVKWK